MDRKLARQPSKSLERDHVEKRGGFTIFSFYRFFGLILISIPLGFYVVWNILYNDWGDIGMYSFVAPVTIFGILFVALGFEKENESKA